MNDNHHILPKNFWTEHQYNVGMGDGKEIKCFGHRITDKKMMDKLLQKSLQGVMTATAKEMCNLEQKIKMQTQSPQASVLREVQLPSTKKEVDKKVTNLAAAINNFGDMAKENLPKITEATLDQRITPVTQPSEDAVPVLSSEDHKIAMNKSLAKTQSALSEVANNAAEGISHAGDTLKSLALSQSTSARNAVTSGFDSLKDATKEQASKLYNQFRDLFATPTAVPASQGGGKRTRRRGKRKRRRTKHKRKRKKSTRKRKKRTRRRR